jgi:hypothetical protein
VAIGSQTSARNKIMDVGMVGHIATPGVEHAHHAKLAADKTGILSQELSSGSRGAEEEVVEELLMAAGYASEFAGQSEGEEEVAGREEQVLLLF